MRTVDVPFSQNALLKNKNKSRDTGGLLPTYIMCIMNDFRPRRQESYKLDHFSFHDEMHRESYQSIFEEVMDEAEPDMEVQS